MIVFATIGGVDHARDMARGGQHEALLAAQQLGAAIGGFPGRDMILPRRQEIRRGFYLGQIDRHAGQGDAAGFAQ